MLKELKLIDEMICNERVFDALKSIRLLYALEAQILSRFSRPDHFLSNRTGRQAGGNRMTTIPP